MTTKSHFRHNNRVGKKLWQSVTCSENLVKTGYAVPETGLQTDRHVHHDTLLPKHRGGVLTGKDTILQKITFLHKCSHNEATN